MPAKDPQGRKWLITINNPKEKDWSHKKIKTELSKISSINYYCLGDEQGETYHTHIFMMSGMRSLRRRHALVRIRWTATRPARLPPLPR